ncbi:MAG: leucine-rich repeat domain-containing protein [Bacteroidota bacterium]
MLPDNEISDCSFLKNLSELKTLDLSYNNGPIINFPKIFNKLTSLKLNSDKISDCSFLEGANKLKTLDLSNNQISDVSPLKGLTELERLRISDNHISEIDFLKNLNKLRFIDLIGNYIKKIPISLFQLNLKMNKGRLDSNELFLSENPIESPPIEIIKQGRQAVIDWFDASKKKLNEIKIILIGDPKAGKTSILKRLKEDQFDEKEVQTDGINIEDIIFAECDTFANYPSLHDLTAHFWDFGGQEIMNATHQFFLTNRSVYLLVLDSRKDTNVAGQIRQWVKRVKTTGGSSPIIVVANQSDVNTGFGFSNESDLQIEFPEIKYFIKISCKTGIGIDDIKNALEQLIPKAELFNTEIDERWIAIKEQLQEETKTNHYLDETRFKEICSINKLDEKQARLNAINFAF